MKPLDLVRQLYDAFGRRDWPEVRAVLAPDVEWTQNEGFPDGGRHVGADAVIDGVFVRFRDNWQHWQAVVEEWLEAGDVIIALGEYRGVHRVTGRSVVAAFAHVYEVRDNRIIRFRQYTDTALIRGAVA